MYYATEFFSITLFVADIQVMVQSVECDVQYLYAKLAFLGSAIMMFLNKNVKDYTMQCDA